MSAIAFQIFVHLPGVVLAPGVALDHAGGSVAAMSHAHWSTLDDEVARKRHRQFASTHPHFFTRAITLAIDDDDEAAPNPAWRPDQSGTTARKEAALETAMAAASEVQLALILYSGVPLPPVEHSISYMTDGNSSFRRIGRFDRQALVNDKQEVMVSRAMADEVLALLPLVIAGAPALALGAVAQAVATLGATTLPDFEAIDGLIHAAIALEAILLADITSGVTRAFAERGAALLATAPDEIPALRSRLSAIYALRSDAMHGRDWRRSPALGGDSVEALYRWQRRALARALVRILHVTRGLAAPHDRLASLRGELDAARRSGTIPSSLAGAPAGPLL